MYTILHCTSTAIALRSIALCCMAWSGTARNTVLSLYCRKSKPVRESEALLQEEDLQKFKAEELANREAVAAEAAADVEQDACDFRATPSMDLCSTERMLSVFEKVL